MNSPGFVFGLPDLNDGIPWSEEDERDLKAAVEDGYTLDQAATFLCRSGTKDEVATKAEELGLMWKPAAATKDR